MTARGTLNGRCLALPHPPCSLLPVDSRVI